jgi:hypothetical protein
MMASARKRKAAELRRGWAENRIKSLRKILAQTEATRSIMPAWAITAVPGLELECPVFVVGPLERLAYDEIVVERPSILLRCIANSAEQRLVFSQPLFLPGFSLKRRLSGDACSGSHTSGASLQIWQIGNT